MDVKIFYPTEEELGDMAIMLRVIESDVECQTSGLAKVI